MKLSYPQLLRQLYNTNWFNPVKLGLENMHRLNSLLNDPLHSIPIVHVTGTNGKGSVSLKIARALSASGIRTGLYTSPHISSFKERIEIDGIPITEEEVEELLPNLFQLCLDHEIPATFFELATALAFQKFHFGKCEAVVLEVGLGGRLDATNIVNPILSIITTVQFDHMYILGDTIEKIAREKAGIIKPGVDALIGPGCPQQQMKDHAALINAPLHTIYSVLPIEKRLHNEQDPIFSDTDYLNTDIALAGLTIIQQQNHNIAKRIQIDSEGVKAALYSRPICRFELFNVLTGSAGSEEASQVKVILDMAHNVDALKALVARTKSHFPNSSIRIVLGMSSDKDITSCLPLYLELANHDLNRIYCTAAHSPRALGFTELRERFFLLAGQQEERKAFKDGEIRDVVKVAIRDAIEEQGHPHDIDYSIQRADQNTSKIDPKKNSLVIICGTAFIMAEARTEIGIIESKDGDILSDNNPISQFKDAQEVFPQKDPSK